MTYLNKLNYWISRFEEWVLLIVVIFMVLMAFLQVVLRNLFDVGILWGDILLRHLVLWVGFVGASIATKENKHINIDVLKRLLSEKWNKRVQLIIDLISAFVAGYLGVAAWRFVMDEKLFGTTIFNDIPVWYFQIIIPIGFFLISIRFIISGLNQFYGETRRKQK